MGRYGRYNKPDMRITKDFDVSTPDDAEEILDNNEQPNIVTRIGSSLKERYQRYNSPDARMERRNKELAKRSRKIEDLSYNAKKEGLKAQIRKSKQVAPMDYGFGITGVSKKGKRQSSTGEGIMHFPRPAYDSMDRMLGMGGTRAKPKYSKATPKSEWGSFDRMFGI